ncbi:TIP-1 family-domain-containing protein [Pilobolus umbonatus]|nr:TIP-1 family-domain-containing protein [Pilobolus umbonatus]
MVSVKEDVSVYVNSHISTLHDLDLSHVKSLLNERKEEQRLLDNKLPLLTEQTRTVISDSLERAEAQQSSLEKLSQSLQEVDESIEQFIPTTDLSDSSFLSKIKQLENKLRVIDEARVYLKALLVSNELSSQALELVKSQPEQAFTPYTQLVRFEKYLKEQSITHSHYQQLANHLHQSQLHLWDELRTILTSNFKQILDKLSWPTPIKAPYGPQLKATLKEFEQAFRHLLLLQLSSESYSHSIHLIPISIMVESLSLRFRYHFETSKPTNRLDKPEWYLTHVTKSISTHIPFIMSEIQPIIENMMDQFEEKVVVKDYFITGVLEDVSRKLRRSMAQLVNQPHLLSHTVHEVLEFDHNLQEEFAYKGVMNISDVILGNPVWFNLWFEAERNFAQTRYDEMMMDRDAFNIYAEDGMMGEENQPKIMQRTVSAVRLLNLLESVIKAYNLVPNLTQKLKFVIDIQLSLLHQYQRRLSSAIESFEAMSLIRSVPVPGALPDGVTSGIINTGGNIAAFHRLYRWWTSARTITDELKEWTEDEFFLEILDGMNSDMDVTRHMLEGKTAKDNLISLSSIKSSSMEGLFADALAAYHQLNGQIEKTFIRIILKEWTTNARPYSKKDIWWRVLDDHVPSEISDELCLPLESLSMTFTYLHTILPQIDFLNLYQKTMKEVEEWYWRCIITSSQFSAYGIHQLEIDLKMGLWKIGKRWVNKPDNYTRRLKETLQLLTFTFPSETEITQHELPSYNIFMRSLGDPSQAEWVKHWLKILGIEVLNNAQIRDVLRRRNDMLHSWN